MVDLYLVISYTFLITLLTTYNYFDIISKTQTRDKTDCALRTFWTSIVKKINMNMTL